MAVHIYKLIDPRDNSIFYIGKTKHKDVRARLNEHIYSRKRFRHKTATKIEKIISLGLRPTIETLFTVNEVGWEEKEIKTIKAYIDSGHKLTNLSIGGDGANGVISKQRVKI